MSNQTPNPKPEAAEYLCRIKLPIPIQFVAQLAGLFPGENIRMKDEGGYPCIFDSENADVEARQQ